MKTIYIRVVILIFILFSTSLFAQKLAVLIDEFPPFNYTKNSKIEGMASDIVRAVLDITSFEYKITSYPWSRAYKMAQSDSNTLIFSISRIEKREKLFKWIGVIAPASYSVFSLKDAENIKINNLDDLKKYQIGTVIKDVNEAYLLTKGFKLNDFQRVAGENAYIQNYKKLLKKRIDVLPMSDIVMDYISKEQGDNPSKILKKVYTLSEISTGGAYIAASLKTKDEIVLEIQKALEAFKQTSKYQLILKKWGI